MDLVRAAIARKEAKLERERIARDADQIRARCRSLAGFVREAWPVLEPNARYIHSWHIDAICEHLEAVTDGRITRLLINVPPGSMKSLIVSVLWPAWEWGPKSLRSLRYIATAFNEGPVKRDTRKSRDLILSEWFQALWPEVRLVRTGEISFANSATGTREGVAFGSLTSQRGDRLIIDDPHSTETAESETERENTTRRFREGALNRLNDQQRSAIIVIMQRLHQSDISGVILSLKMDYVHLCLPMEFEPARRCSTQIGFTDPRTYDGELLVPERFPRSEIEKYKKATTAYAYAGQYQQRPAPREGGLFERRWFQMVRAAPAGVVSRVRRWDLAGTEANGKNDPDWTAGVLMSRDALGIVYIEDVIRFRGSPADVERAILATASQDEAMYGNVTVGLPQDPAQAGKFQVRYLAGQLAGFIVKIERERDHGDKETRAAPLSAQAEVGNVRLVVGAWNEAFLSEVELFPAAAHDDQVDAASGAFLMLATPTAKLSFG